MSVKRYSAWTRRLSAVGAIGTMALVACSSGTPGESNEGSSSAVTSDGAAPPPPASDAGSSPPPPVQCTPADDKSCSCATLASQIAAENRAAHDDELAIANLKGQISQIQRDIQTNQSSKDQVTNSFPQYFDWHMAWHTGSFLLDVVGINEVYDAAKCVVKGAAQCERSAALSGAAKASTLTAGSRKIGRGSLALCKEASSGIPVVGPAIEIWGDVCHQGEKGELANKIQEAIDGLIADLNQDVSKLSDLNSDMRAHQSTAAQLQAQYDRDCAPPPPSGGSSDAGGGG